MSSIRTSLTDEEAAILDTMSERVVRGLAEVTQAVCEAVAEQASVQLQAAIAAYVAHIAGQVAARAEFVAFNAGGSNKDVEDLCCPSFYDGREAAYNEQRKSGGLKIPNAPTTGAHQ